MRGKRGKFLKMKRKSNLLTLFLTALLLAGCCDKAEENNSSNNSGNNTNNSSENNKTGDGGNTSGNEEVVSIVGPKMTEAAWDKMFSDETFSDLKVTGTNVLNPMKEPFMGPMITRSIKNEFVYTSAGGKGYTQILTNDQKFEIFDSDYEEFLDAEPDILNIFGDAETAYEQFLVSLSNSFGKQPVRNSTDDGYVISVGLEKPINVYYEQADNKDTVYTYHFDDESEKYFKILSFVSDTVDFDNGAFLEINNLKSLNGCFDKVAYNEKKNCYEVSFSLLYKGDDIGNYDIPLYLYFNNGLLTKVTYSGEYDESSQIEYLFSDYGKNKITLPTNLNTCNHKNIGYYRNEDYHCVYCYKCGNLAEYGKHIYKDGFCETCDYCDSDLEIISGSDEVEHVYLYKNVLTGKYFKGDFSDFYSSSNSELTETEYVCFDETCDLTCVRTYEDRIPINGSPCEYYEVSNVSFYEGETKVHDDAVIEEKIIEHSYEILDMQPLEDEVLDVYDYHDEDLGLFHGSVKCKKCGKVVDGVDIYVGHSDDKFDYFTFYKPGYEDFVEYGHLPHQVDEMNSKCICCGKNEDEITKVYPMPAMDVDFFEVTADEFKKDYDGEWTYIDFTSTINATFYIGNTEYVQKFTDALSYENDSWNSTIDKTAISDCVSYVSTTSSGIISNVISISKNDSKINVKFYNSEDGIGLIVSDDGYGVTKFYYNEGGLLIRYEYITHNGYTARIATFSM